MSRFQQYKGACESIGFKAPLKKKQFNKMGNPERAVLAALAEALAVGISLRALPIDTPKAKQTIMGAYRILMEYPGEAEKVLDWAFQG